MAGVVVGWPVFVLCDPEDAGLLVVCPALVVYVDSDVTGMLMV